jgi:hypothetical protein
MRVLAILAILGGALTALAQPSAPSSVILPKVVLTEPADARSAPPSGPLNVFVGQKVKSLPKGAEVEVVGRKTYGAFGGTNVWLEVQPPRAATSGSRSSPVWIYGGVQEGTNVVPSGVTPVK